MELRLGDVLLMPLQKAAGSRACCEIRAGTCCRPKRFAKRSAVVNVSHLICFVLGLIETREFKQLLIGFLFGSVNSAPSPAHKDTLESIPELPDQYFHLFYSFCPTYFITEECNRFKHL